MPERFDVVVIGGGPAGSVAARTIAAAGYAVALLEKDSFPREKVCGEFLSAEVGRTISEMGLEREFQALHPNPLRTFSLLTERSSPVTVPLGFTAYGVRRGPFDSMLLEAARQVGVRVIQPAEVTSIEKDHQEFILRYRFERDERTCRAHWVVGAYGANSPLDKKLGRTFARARTGFNGFKYHVPAETIENLPVDEIAIASGSRIYCGISHVDGGKVTVCALERREKGDLSTREKLRAVVRTNPSFGSVMPPSVLDILPTLPVFGTGNVYFGRRELAINEILMVGDSAGMIAPLAGDGIGMAMEQGRLIGKLFAEMRPNAVTRQSFSNAYRREYESAFSSRKKMALLCQYIALSKPMHTSVIPLLYSMPGLLSAAIGATRGNAGHQHVKEYA